MCVAHGGILVHTRHCNDMCEVARAVHGIFFIVTRHVADVACIPTNVDVLNILYFGFTDVKTGHLSAYRTIRT